MSRLEPYTYALFRIVTGFLFFVHGTQKLFGWPVAGAAGMPSYVQYVAGPIEFVGGVMILLGLFTGWAAFLCSGLMAAAYWMVHGPQGFWPIINRGEPAVFYCFAFLFIASRGAGIWSLDALFSGSSEPAYGSRAASRS